MQSSKAVCLHGGKKARKPPQASIRARYPAFSCSSCTSTTSASYPFVSIWQKMEIMPPTDKAGKIQQTAPEAAFTRYNLLMLIAPNIHSTLAVPMLVFAMLKTREAITAPTLPEAAEKPCAKPLIRVGNTSDGTMNVVALPPTDITRKIRILKEKQEILGLTHN